MNILDRLKHSNSLFDRGIFYVYLAGLIVAIPAPVFVRFVLHNETEASLLNLVGILLFLPQIMRGFVRLHQLRQERKRLEIELIVHETVLQILAPERYELLQKMGLIKKKVKK